MFCNRRRDIVFRNAIAVVFGAPSLATVFGILYSETPYMWYLKRLLFLRLVYIVVY